MAKKPYRKKDNREKTQKFLVFFIGIVMISSVFGVIFYGYNDQSTTVKYNGIKFVQKEGVWAAKIDGKDFVFNYLPEDVNIELGNDVRERLNNLIEIDVTSEVNNSYKEYIALAEHQMITGLSNFNIFLRVGFTGENEYGMEIITCEDATSGVPVVYFRLGNETKVYLDGNCIIAEGREGFDFLRVKDALMFSMLGIYNRQV